MVNQQMRTADQAVRGGDTAGEYAVVQLYRVLEIAIIGSAAVNLDLDAKRLGAANSINTVILVGDARQVLEGGGGRDEIPLVHYHRSHG